MRRTILIVPSLISPGGADSPLRQNLPNLNALAEIGTLTKLAPLPPVETPEALYLGLKPSEGQLRQGPLTVAALGADPPERSTHFHLSLLSFADGVVSVPIVEPSAEELRTLMERAERLHTKTLTLLAGEGLDHGLVWEGMGDLGTTPATEVDGQPLRAHLPEGDGETALRRLVDDSVNLLSELPLNDQRIDEGLPRLNLLWPWGHGVRGPVPNLLLRRGERVRVDSASMRLAGLARLSGYTHGDRATFGRGLSTRLRPLADRLLREDVSISLVDALEGLRAKGQEEELHWFVRELDAALLGPLLDTLRREPMRLALLAPRAETGLALTVDGSRRASNVVPFDERALEERTLSTLGLHDSVEIALHP